MSRILAAIAVPVMLFAASLTPAQAAASTAPIDFSRIRCETPEVTDLIRKAVGNMKFEDGTPILSYLGNNSKLTAKTIEATRQHLVCRVTVNFLIRGTPTSIRGRYTMRNAPGGMVSQEFLPGY
jgi:hypothetical protein